MGGWREGRGPPERGAGGQRHSPRGAAGPEGLEHWGVCVRKYVYICIYMYNLYKEQVKMRVMKALAVLERKTNFILFFSKKHFGELQPENSTGSRNLQLLS